MNIGIIRVFHYLSSGRYIHTKNEPLQSTQSTEIQCDNWNALIELNVYKSFPSSTK